MPNFLSPPPGAIIIPTPFEAFLVLEGANTVSEGLCTLVMLPLFTTSGSCFRRLSKPGAPFSHSGIIRFSGAEKDVVGYVKEGHDEEDRGERF